MKILKFFTGEKFTASADPYCYRVIYDLSINEQAKNFKKGYRMYTCIRDCKIKVTAKLIEDEES